MENTIKKKSVEVVNSELVLPGNTNHYGIIFGGKTLAMMDMTGALAAIQFCNEDVVTASFESVDFKKPIRKGEIVKVKAKVIFTSTTSMVVKIDVFKVGKFHTRKEQTCTGFATFVAVDSNGEPRTIPTLEIETEEDKKLWEIGREIKTRAVKRLHKQS
ncbi:MAG: acyl-CoA thioesterase [Candidatus Dadabacteria bacterium]|nr:acyl-CoA thioesterase [Candidatus Dadabacteria bacterium]